MAGFVMVHCLTDIFGHSAAGGWFDALRMLIVDQRAFWILLLLVLICEGAGPFSEDRLLGGIKGHVPA